MKVIIYTGFYLVLSIVIFPLSLNAQGMQGNNWYFSDHAGMTFNYGDPPQLLYDGQIPDINEGVTTMSDEHGNLMFYGNGNTIWNRDHDTMLNGNDVGHPYIRFANQILAIPVPGSSHLYYYITFTNINTCQYSTIDMNLDNGKGGVIPFTKCTFLMSGAFPSVTAVHHKNQTDIWLVLHRTGVSRWHTFLVTAEGIETRGIYDAGTDFPFEFGQYFKLSPDGTKLAASIYTGTFWVDPCFCEIYDFNSETGAISADNITNIRYPANTMSTISVEFSPNSSLLYAKKYDSLFQYDLKAGTPQQIAQSEFAIRVEQSMGDMQLGPDGKIYFAKGWEYMSVLHDPNVRGTGCNYEEKYLYFEDNWEFRTLPYVLPSFLREYEFKAEQFCSGQPTKFSFINTNSIDSVLWKFGDPNNAPYDTSTIFNPSYTYSAPGIYYPKVTIFTNSPFPKVLRDTITILQGPNPDFGNDTTFCADEIIDFELNAGPGQAYTWNGIPGGTQTYQVNSPGTYYVEVFNGRCIGRDTLSVIQYSVPVVDTSNYFITEAKCGDSVGSIKGIQITGDELSYQWKAADGSVVSDSLNLTGMPAGIYTLYITYGKKCTNDPIPFEIKGTIGPQITTIIPKPDHCNQLKGELTVNTSPSGSPLMYSLDGLSYSTSNTFTDLPGDIYNVIVKDVNGCIDTLSTVVQNIAGPVVLDSIATDEYGYNSNGKIIITAEGDRLTYSLIGVDIPQSSGTFTDLPANDYIVKITDKWGCIRLVHMTIQRIMGTVLLAEADGDDKCKKELATSILTVENFINVNEFKAILVYDTTKVTCTGYYPSVNFPDVLVTMLSGSIEVKWHNETPITLQGKVELIDLVFETIDQGATHIKWDTAYSVFIDHVGNRILSDLKPGEIIINDPPVLENHSVKTDFCEGERAELVILTNGGTPPFEINWQTPTTNTTNDSILIIDSILTIHAGDYNIKIADKNNCTDSLEIPVSVYALPLADFPTTNDTIFFEQQTILSAASGYAGYEWNTGDTIYYITVTKEGEYSVLIETEAGCKALESVFMFDTYVPINVPNAFTPNGDGMNDSFKPVVDMELIRRYHLSIYNKWGQLLFETSNSGKGWDGEGVLPGTYVWVIDYENRIGKGFEMKGAVTVLK